ncbi:MAG: putative manganese-dependent inorganic diphosphatase [Solobacterium sp.]|nr:putative manganese-dependent inorganic diphosphatase [Solobacterium sp.]
MSNDIIYVTGHKHPDSDSICSAITYANLLRKTGQEAIACRQGPLNEETKFILKRFNQENPLLLTDARAMLKDIELDKPTIIRKNETVHHAWHVMLQTQNRSLFVQDDDGKLLGICSTSDLSRVRIYPDTSLRHLISTASLANIARTIGGSIVYEPRNWGCNGAISIITLEGKELSMYDQKDRIVILSSGDEKQKLLIDLGAKCLVITCGQGISPSVLSYAKKKKCAVITTDNDTMNTARVITESYSVEQIMSRDVIRFHDTEYVDDVAVKMMNSRVRSYPVLDENDRIVGAISRYHTRNYKRRKFALVDHSAVNQTINNVSQCEITAIIDHHHIGDITTDKPILYRNMKCGCTCTILAGLYKEYGVEPDRDMSGLLLSAILSDTLNFRSATTTKLDIDTAHELAKRAGIDDIDAYAAEMLGASVALKDSTPEEILNRDIKTYQIGKYTFAIGQTNYNHMEDVQAILPAIKEALKKEQNEKKLDLSVMLFTHVLGHGSLFVYYGPLSYIMKDVIQTQFDRHSGFDPNIISRKQQMMPKLSELIRDI